MQSPKQRREYIDSISEFKRLLRVYEDHKKILSAKKICYEDYIETLSKRGNNLKFDKTTDNPDLEIICKHYIRLKECMVKLFDKYDALTIRKMVEAETRKYYPSNTSES